MLVLINTDQSNVNEINLFPFYVKKHKVGSNLSFFCNLQTHLYDIHKVCIQIESQLPIGISNRSLLRYASPNRDKNQNEYVSIKMGFFFALLKNLFLFGELFKEKSFVIINFIYSEKA